jgi:hypothetical protein
LVGSAGVSSNKAERSLVASVTATRLPTICCVDLVTFLTVELGAGFGVGFGVGFDVGSWVAIVFVLSGALVFASLFSPVLLPPSPAPRALRSQPLARDCTGDESGVGDSEGNDVRLFVSAAGEADRASEALELRFEGRTRTVLLFLLIDVDEVCDAVRTRSTALGGSVAAISFETVDRCGHPSRRDG